VSEGGGGAVRVGERERGRKFGGGDTKEWRRMGGGNRGGSKDERRGEGVRKGGDSKGGGLVRRQRPLKHLFEGGVGRMTRAGYVGGAAEYCGREMEVTWNPQFIRLGADWGGGGVGSGKKGHEER